jgi:hypothetical protein
VLSCEKANQIGKTVVPPDFQDAYLVNVIPFGAIISRMVDDNQHAHYRYTPITAIDMQAK